MITNEQLMGFKKLINKELDKLIKGNIQCEIPKVNQIKIGDQVWMNINLHYDDGGDGIYYCDYNDEYYYSWEAAMRVAKLFPPGWHLPSNEDWNKLEKFIEDNIGPKLRSRVGWSKYSGTDDYGFNAKPSGYYRNGHFDHLGSNAYFWASSEYLSYYAYCRNLDTGTMTESNYNYKTFGYSVRLLRDSK